jgi:NTP pyrophosphatase (non-canonical NTP hydrolase)
MEIKDMIDIVGKFRDERDWDKLHYALDLAVGMSIECSEVLELTRFMSREEVIEKLKEPEFKKKFSHELADVLIFMLAICNKSDIDIEKAFLEKMEINKANYPVEKSKGRKEKYNQL